MKITIYELLGMIKEEKIPKKIKYDGSIWELEEDGLYYRDNLCLEDYCNIIQHLNDEVEILEEEKKIPKKLENGHEFYSYTGYEKNKYEIDKVLYILKAINLTEEKIDNLNNSINEIIDYLESKGE